MQMQHPAALTHREKVQHFLTEMERRNIPPYDAAPPLFRFAWSRGSEIEPPWFMSFGKAWLVAGGIWGTLFMVAFLGPLFLLPLPLELRLKLVLLVAGCGALFGFLMALLLPLA